jgi:hypothetical protein
MNGSRGCRPIVWLANAALGSLAFACAATHGSDPVSAGRGAAGATDVAADGGAGAEHPAAGVGGGAANAGEPVPTAGDAASAGQAGSSITLPVPADCSPACGMDQRCEQRQTFCAKIPCATQATCVGNTFSPDAGVTYDCNLRNASCTLPAPICDYGAAPVVSNGCYGSCVPIEYCACQSEQDCPDNTRCYGQGESGICVTPYV